MSIEQIIPKGEYRGLKNFFSENYSQHIYVVFNADFESYISFQPNRNYVLQISVAFAAFQIPGFVAS